MTDIDPTQFASLLCSRLCHDMLSPVGALSNGLELMRDEQDPEMRERCMELLEQSAATSTAKLKFFRLAFGAAGGYGDRVPVDEPQGLIAALLAGNDRIRLNWAISESQLPKPAVKVLLNLAQLAIDALVRGGDLDIGVEGRDGATEIAVRATGPKIAFDRAIGAALDGTMAVSELSSRTAAAHMVNLTAQQTGGGVQYMMTDDTLVLGAVLPGADDGMIG